MREIIAGGPEKAFSFMVDHVADYAIFLLDVKGTVLTWNKASEQMKGYTAEEVIGLAAFDEVPAASRKSCDVRIVPATLRKEMVETRFTA